jgi:hypothetical protein
MSTSATARTWTATIAYGDQITFPCWTSRETVTADLSENDLQRDQAYVAQLEATQYLLAGAATSAYVQLHKTTKSGTRNDRGFAMDLWDAEIFALRHATRRSTQITPRPVMPHPDERVLFGSTTTNRELRDALRKDKS